MDSFACSWVHDCTMSVSLSKKVCIITGTGGSMGRASALAFAREGASVVGCDLSVDAGETTIEMVRWRHESVVICFR
jgi:NAD(P)-dependent dehydrogenase (short-subunit alcohol dehydrogenase family)